ncbi:MAG: YafY family transcriptional regulator [Spirochaetes bacterium]|jgi:predicted DNA-binding transcriptional regulator YafY|nr:YafY family transcriptional regulator [Spirochaetota bacterium]
MQTAYNPINPARTWSEQMRLDRMLSIIVMLLNKDRISAKDLSEKFEVSVRTIYRDIESINLAGIPIVSYQGNSGGFGIMENYRLDRQVLTLKDMTSILSALKGISPTLENRELDGAIEKIASLLPRGGGSLNTDFGEQMVIDILPWGYRKRQKKILHLVNESIRDRMLIGFLYRNSAGKSVRRKIEPMTLIFKGYAWYLFAFCRLKNDYRLFRLSRISGIEVIPEHFSRRSASYKDYMKDGEPDREKVDLTLEFTPEARFMVEDYFDEESIEVKDDGRMTVKASFIEDEWVYSLLLSYGEKVRVVAPERIRKALGEKAKKILTLCQT